jgi:hypothetical protein
MNLDIDPLSGLENEVQMSTLGVKDLAKAQEHDGNGLFMLLW